MNFGKDAATQFFVAEIYFLLYKFHEKLRAEKRVATFIFHLFPENNALCFEKH
jgi:hypothetical protein